MNTRSVFQKRFLRKRAELGGSQADFVQLLRERTGHRVAPSMVSGWETGKKGASMETLAAVSIALETNPAYLLGLTDDDAPLSDLDDQVLVVVRREPERRRKPLQALCEDIERLPDEDMAIVAATVERFTALRSQNTPSRRKQSAMDRALENEIVALLHTISRAAGGEHVEELAAEVTLVASKAGIVSADSVEILRMVAQQAAERMQRGRGSVAECDA